MGAQKSKTARKDSKMVEEQLEKTEKGSNSLSITLENPEKAEKPLESFQMTHYGLEQTRIKT